MRGETRTRNNSGLSRTPLPLGHAHTKLTLLMKGLEPSTAGISSQRLYQLGHTSDLKINHSRGGTRTHNARCNRPLRHHFASQLSVFISHKEYRVRIKETKEQKKTFKISSLQSLCFLCANFVFSVRNKKLLDLGSNQGYTGSKPAALPLGHRAKLPQKNKTPASGTSRSGRLINDF